MGVYIPDMDMPTGCHDCLLCNRGDELSDDWYCEALHGERLEAKNKTGIKRADCPLSEAPRFYKAVVTTSPGEAKVESVEAVPVLSSKVQEAGLTDIIRKIFEWCEENNLMVDIHTYDRYGGPGGFAFAITLKSGDLRYKRTWYVPGGAFTLKNFEFVHSLEEIEIFLEEAKEAFNKEGARLPLEKADPKPLKGLFEKFLEAST